VSTPAADADTLLDRLVIVLYETQDLVNIALVVRAMKNMGLRRLRLVRPVEFDAYRIDGIAHDTSDLVARIEHFHDLPTALADVTFVVGTTARRRKSVQKWWMPEQGAREIVSRAGFGQIAVLFGREDRGLANDDLDLCHALLSIPVSGEHPSMNLGQAAAVVLYELRKAVDAAVGLDPRDFSPKKSQKTGPATADDMETFFHLWEQALTEVGLFQGLDPVPKMRSFRSIFQRAEPNRREVGLLQAAAYEILHFVRGTRDDESYREASEGSGTLGGDADAR